MRRDMVLLLLVVFGLILGVEYLKNTKLRIWVALGIFVTFLGVGALLPGDFTHQKIIARLIMPVGLIWMLLLSAFVFDLRSFAWERALLSGLTFLLFSVSGNTYIGSTLIRSLESELATAPVYGQKLDAIFILGGGTTLGPRRQPELGPSGDRVRLAAQLYHEGVSEALVTSGQSPPPFGLGDLSAHTTKILMGMGVQEDNIMRISEPVNTIEEMAAYQELAKQQGWTRVGLISSAWHLPRALEHVRGTAIQFTPLPADHRARLPKPIGPLDLIPCNGGFGLVETWTWETIGRLVGR